MAGEELRIRPRCPSGGDAPCIDDLCRGVDMTMCGLWRGEDFCEHGYIPETCDLCSDADDREFCFDDYDEYEGGDGGG